MRPATGRIFLLLQLINLRLPETVEIAVFVNRYNLVVIEDSEIRYRLLTGLEILDLAAVCNLEDNSLNGILFKYGTLSRHNSFEQA